MATPKKNQLKIISLGWGVQSFALAAMSALGVLPPVDAAVHADTGWERAETYEFAARFTPWLEERGVQVVTVSAGDCRFQLQNPDNGQTHIPLFTTRGPQLRLKPGGEFGQLRRSCTQRWKIVPQRRWISAELKRQGLEKSPGIVEKWLGISWDEARRVQLSGVKYITLKYPFIEMFDSPWMRQMVIKWLRDNNLGVPPKSSCIICPYHSRATWREIQLSDSGDWERALEADEAIRNKRPGYFCYLTSQHKPLGKCDFRSQEERGQLALWRNNGNSKQEPR